MTDAPPRPSWRAALSAARTVAGARLRGLHATTRLRASLRDAWDSLLAVLLPPLCGTCGAALARPPRYGLCPACLALLERQTGRLCPVCAAPDEDGLCGRCAQAPPPFTRVLAPYVYGGPLAELIAAVKFRRQEHLAMALGRLLADEHALQAAVADARCLVPVPLGPRRRRERGFNQSAVLARGLGRAAGVPVRHALTRVRNTMPQSDLPLGERAANVQAAFRPRLRLDGKCVLVDDVVTSGETARQAAAALREAGAREVWVVALARTPLE